MASRALTELAKEMLEGLPPFYENDRVMEATVDAVAQELERIEAAAVAVRDGLGWPQLATDEMRLLGMWETLLDLPVEPSDATLAQRVNTVIASRRSRQVASGAAWEAAITKMLGGSWESYEGPGEYELTIVLPYEPGGYRASQVREMVRRVTPAHLHVTVDTGESFLVGGPSQIGLDTL